MLSGRQPHSFSNSGKTSKYLAVIILTGHNFWSPNFVHRNIVRIGALLGTLERLWTLQERSWLDFGAPEKDFRSSESRFQCLRDSIWEFLAIDSENFCNISLMSTPQKYGKTSAVAIELRSKQSYSKLLQIQLNCIAKTNPVTTSRCCRTIKQLNPDA